MMCPAPERTESGRHSSLRRVDIRYGTSAARLSQPPSSLLPTTLISPPSRHASLAISRLCVLVGLVSPLRIVSSTLHKIRAYIDCTTARTSIPLVRKYPLTLLTPPPADRNDDGQLRGRPQWQSGVHFSRWVFLPDVRKPVVDYIVSPCA